MSEKFAHLEEWLAQQKKDEFVKDFFQGASENLLEERSENEAEIITQRKENEELNTKLIEMQAKAERDKLTGLLNREGFESVIKRIVKEGNEGSLMILDIDNFKKINDTYGHPGGDQVLSQVADALKKMCRKSDLVCRWGGEEIVIFFPGAKPEDIYKIFKLRDKDKAEINVPVQVINEEKKQELTITFSGGIVKHTKSDDIENSVNLADQILYEVKKSGKNEIKFKTK